jgi:hypothetical protein
VGAEPGPGEHPFDRYVAAEQNQKATPGVVRTGSTALRKA